MRLLREEQRAAIRAREGFEGKRVVVFPGSTGRWHHIPATLSFLAAWMKEEPLLHFVALCPDVEAMNLACLGALPQDSYTIRHVAHDEVPVNFVASPTKFAEYALTGLPVAMSQGIGDYSDLVLSERAGFHVNDNRLEHSVERAAAFMALWKASDRQRWSKSAEGILSKGARLEDLVQEYHSLGET